ncbi:LysR family transcriptional regulator [Streptomyces cocklensis]|uniref:DNA-binding transcriptional regulator, LysR family n=1 Tax=Actinacidiphila cocklensis TaxID=887465 RepID=A0A9W4EBD5_9ACTN|nr:LysR family transcriptional regulator [Actinacidiphila cocklensis]MDD1064186.1 LysR family transcriptional regulator [Actinacidiphila cocklensis]WSX75554.1 LysR family transcriptional regulator [Streptomyces sp. NBC_00899]CAG6398596.1 DNA-binding transcriptional regulator, LysR family [Actinacidiphila cocklensis]
MLDIRQLEVLAEIARTGSYTAAAASLGYTQPAVSYQMRRLQQTVGAPLVTRAGRGVRLTQTGQALARHAETIFSALRAADQDIASQVARGGGLVRTVSFQSGCVSLLPEVVGRLRDRHPDVHITLTQAEPVQARELIRSGAADLGLLCNWANEDVPEGEQVMMRVPLMTDRRCVVMREDHPLAGRSEIGLAELADHDWVMESFRDRFEAACTNLGFEPRISATVDDSHTVLALVGTGLGISLMNEMALRSHLCDGLVYRPLLDWPLRRTYALLWPDMVGVPAVAAVLAEIRRAARLAQGEISAAPGPGC